MGINGLLKALSPLLVPENQNLSNVNADTNVNSSGATPNYNIQQFANKSLAIDASSWLFKASYSCAEKLVEGIESNPHYIDPHTERSLSSYIIRRCEELIRHASIRRIYLVFDGKRCPLKEVTNKQREERRRECLKEARRLKRIGRNDMAGDKYRACVKVTDRMAECVARAVRQKWGVSPSNANYCNHGSSTSGTRRQSTFLPPRVNCVFSPYEADAQLVKLCIDGVTDAIVTEVSVCTCVLVIHIYSTYRDLAIIIKNSVKLSNLPFFSSQDSDVLVYSAACNASFPIIYKLSRDDGSCDVFTMDWLLSPPPASICMTTEQNSNCAVSVYPSIKRQLLTRNHNNRQQSSATDKSKRDNSMNKLKKQKHGQGAALLSHLHAMSSRERRQKGSGARMFVQACVLAGCDYAPSRLAGVGLVTAFKMIKENAHRNVGARFQNVLNSIPREKILLLNGGGSAVDERTINASTSSTNSKNGDILHAIQTYETLLAKSEAVFYYHHVRHFDSGKVVPLNEKNQDLTTKGSHREFLPCTSRFDDITFTGKGLDINISSFGNTSSSGSINKALCTPPTVPANPYSVERKTPFDLKNTSSRSQKKISSITKKVSAQDEYNKKNNVHSFLTAKKDKMSSIMYGSGQQKPSSSKPPNELNFSQYAFKKSPNNGTTQESKGNTNIGTKLLVSSSIDVQTKSREQCINASDSDSDESLDETSNHFYFKRVNANRQCSTITPSSTVRDSQTSYSSMSSSESLSSNKNECKRSKYFTFDDFSDKRSDSIGSLDHPILSPIVPSTLTPKASTNNQRNENNGMTGNGEDFGSTNGDSNDCVIVDDPYREEEKNIITNTSQGISSKRKASQSIFVKFRDQTQKNEEEGHRKDFSRSGKTSVSRFFNKSVQHEKSHKEFFPSWAKAYSSGTTPKKKQNSVVASSSVKKRGRATSIKAFFIPLNTTKKRRVG